VVPTYQILAVDDEKFSLVLLQSCLKDENCTLVTCDNALDALEEIKKRQFDVVLLDIMLGAIDGFELRKLIRDVNPKLPIIFLTSLMDDIDSRLISRIADDRYSYYLNKSFKKQQLKDKIEHAVTIYREEQEAAKFYRHLDLELGLACEVQRVLLPLWCTLNGDLLSTYLYEPCFRVSGDAFDIIGLEDGRHLVFLGDIVGHGVQAALYMSAIQSYLKVQHNSSSSQVLEPHMVLNRLSGFFNNNLRGENHMTCIVAIFDFRRNHLVFQNAGHPALIRCSRREGRAFEVDTQGRGGFPIGWFPQKMYLAEDNVECNFDDDDVFILYTDGLIDLQNEAEETVDEEVMLDHLGAFTELTNVIPTPFLLCSALEQIGYSFPKDDVCVVEVRKNPECIPLPETADGEQLIMLRLISLRTAEVSRCVEQFGRFVQERTDDEELATRVELLLSEFLNNVVEHDEETHTRVQSGILVVVKIEPPDQVLATVLDRQSGTAEDKLHIPMPEDASEVLEHCNRTLTSSGRGLAIIRTIADSIMRKHFKGLNQTEFVIKAEKPWAS
jgi:sigma-B regulation protein RsbU (phosphoserine phosphatase)